MTKHSSRVSPGLALVHVLEDMASSQAHSPGKLNLRANSALAPSNHALPPGRQAAYRQPARPPPPRSARRLHPRQRICFAWHCGARTTQQHEAAAAPTPLNPTLSGSLGQLFKGAEIALAAQSPLCSPLAKLQLVSALRAPLVRAARVWMLRIWRQRQSLQGINQRNRFVQLSFSPQTRVPQLLSPG